METGNDEIKLSLFTYDLIFFFNVGNQKTPLKTIHKKFGKNHSMYNQNTQIAFLSKEKKYIGKNLGHSSHTNMATKNIKYLGINLPCGVKDLKITRMKTRKHWWNK